MKYSQVATVAFIGGATFVSAAPLSIPTTSSAEGIAARNSQDLGSSSLVKRDRDEGFLATTLRNYHNFNAADFHKKSQSEKQKSAMYGSGQVPGQSPGSVDPSMDPSLGPEGGSESFVRRDIAEDDVSADVDDDDELEARSPLGHEIKNMFKASFGTLLGLQPAVGGGTGGYGSGAGMGMGLGAESGFGGAPVRRRSIDINELN